MNYVVEPMCAEDIPQVIEIERHSFPTMWPANTYRRELQNQRARYLVVLEEDGGTLQPTPEPVMAASMPPSALGRFISGVRHLLSKESPPTSATSRHVVGYLGLWLMFDEAHVTTVAVDENHRRHGLGELLLIAAIDLASQLGLQVLTLEVRASNEGAQDLYRKLGFRQVGIRRGYYTDSREDAIIMSTDTITVAAYQGLFQRMKEEHFHRWAEHQEALNHLPLSNDA